MTRPLKGEIIEPLFCNPFAAVVYTGDLFKLHSLLYHSVYECGLCHVQE